MDQNTSKLDDAIEYVVRIVKNTDPEDLYDYREFCGKMLEIVGYLMLLKINSNL